jgi:hypothetical protein
MKPISEMTPDEVLEALGLSADEQQTFVDGSKQLFGAESPETDTPLRARDSVSTDPDIRPRA